MQKQDVPSFKDYFPFRTSTLFMFVDTGPFPLPFETINYLTGNLSGCNGLSGLAQFRTFIFISLSGTPGFLCGNNKDQVLILGRNSSRTYQHPFQLPVNIYLKFGIAGSAIASTLAEMGSLIILLIHMWRKIDKTSMDCNRYLMESY